MHAKLSNGFLHSAPKTITLDGKTINNPLPEELEELGYKPVVYTDMPTDAPSGQHYESGWGRGRQDSSDVDAGRRSSLSRAGAERR